MKKTKKSENPSAFKNWINEKVVEGYGAALKSVDPKFDKKSFTKFAVELSSLELRERVKLVALNIKSHLPEKFPEALSRLMRAIKKHNLSGFALWPATEFIQMYGLDHKTEAFLAMRELTVRFTSEFAVRPFIARYPKWTMAELALAAEDTNVHVRRWASEGSRPRLPWGERLHDLVKDPKPGLIILEKLKFDPELYVRKSVANHLNDIAKDHPMLVVQTLRRWQKSVPKSYEKEFRFVVNRSLRTLIKNGHPEALKLVGVQVGNNQLKIERIQIDRKVKMGESLELSMRLKNLSKKPQTFVIDYEVWHKKANGKLTAKVFKLKSGTLSGGQVLEVRKKHSFKPVTTRSYFAGEHQIAVLLNGLAQPKKSFLLENS